MGGKEGGRGYLYQGIVAVLAMLGQLVLNQHQEKRWM